MKHLGDITKIHGDKIEPVDCITFGSPCQDLSIAGRRAGLAGERSGLFMEAVRIIKEMRSSTNGLYPTFAIWENVPGAFSSNGGEDFRAVLEELARVEQPDASIPRPQRGGRWSKAGAIAGNGWSLAWRQLDAQYWGVPQRRKRIALVADFGGQRAAEILFERTGVSRDSDESIPPWKSVTGLAQNCATGDDRVEKAVIPINTQIATRHVSLGERTGMGWGKAGDPAYTLQAGHEHGVCYCIAGNIIDRSETAGANGVGATENVSYTLNTVDRHAVAYSFDSLASNSMKSSNPYSGCREVELARTLDTSIPDPSKNQGGIAIVEPVAYTVKIRSGCEGGGKGALVQTEKSATLSTLQDQTLFVADVLPFDTTQVTSPQNGCNPKWGDPCHPLATSAHTPTVVMKVYDNHAQDARYSELKGVSSTVTARWETGGGNTPIVTRQICNGSECPAAEKTIRWIVRRLTPVECERLQGFPSGWTDIGNWTDSKGKKHKYADSPRYKALGNSIALPQWFWIAQKMKPFLSENATLGSLFDGIGGFPLVWQRAYGEGTARWASEIESFCVAVTKRRFGEE